MRRPYLLGTVLVVALVTSCSGSAEEAAPRTAPSTNEPASAAAAPSSPSESMTASPAGGEVTASKTLTRTAGGRPNSSMRLDLLGLHRDGKLLRLDYRLTNLTDARLFGGDFINILSPDEVYLVDTTGLKKYLPVRDTKKEALLSRPTLYLDLNQVFTGTAYFANPPETVTTLDVVFDTYGTYKTPVT